MVTYPKTAIFGFIAWLTLVFIWQPHIKHDEWARLLLFLAVLVIIPIGFSLLDDLNKKLGFTAKITFPAAILLIVAFHLSPSVEAAFLTIPWVLLSIIVFIRSVKYFNLNLSVSDLTVMAAQVFLSVGAFSALFDRLNYQPFGFDTAIILLTAIHFHFAGFTFTLLCGLLASYTPSVGNRLACWLAIVAVPLTAIGITISQVYHYFIIESMAAITVSIAGFLCAFGHFKLVFTYKNVSFWIKTLWIIVGISLIFTMSLAVLYALRPWLYIDFINIPNMRALHGSANAFGVAGAGILSWRLFLNNNK